MLDVLWCFGEAPASLILSSVLIDPRGFVGKSFDSVCSRAFSGLLLDSLLNIERSRGCDERLFIIGILQPAYNSDGIFWYLRGLRAADRVFDPQALLCVPP